MISVGTIKFDDRLLDVYRSLEEPIFKALDVAKMIDYSEGNTTRLLELCEEDEKLNLPVVVAGQRRNINFVTETGLYNILSQSRKPLARKWRRVIHDQLVQMRRAKGMDILQQFDEWDRLLDDLYFDADTGILMQSVTVQGGDVEQVIYRGDI